MTLIKLFKIGLSLLMILVFTSCKEMQMLKDKASRFNNFEKKALQLVKENRELRYEVENYKNEIQNLNVKMNYCEVRLKERESFEQQLKKKLKGNKRRSSHSAAKKGVDKLFRKNEVNYDIYKWKSNQLLSLALEYFKAKNYEMASKYFYNLVKHYPNDKAIDDNILLMTAISFNETNSRLNLAVELLDRLVIQFPESNLFRSAKLWRGISKLKLGDNDYFVKTVEEFRLKYKNTPEWKIISLYYENFKLKF